MGYVKFSSMTNLSCINIGQLEPLRPGRYAEVDLDKIKKQGADDTGSWFICSFNYNGEMYWWKRMYFATDKDGNKINTVYNGNYISGAKADGVYAGGPNPPFSSTGGDGFAITDSILGFQEVLSLYRSIDESEINKFLEKNIDGHSVSFINDSNISNDLMLLLSELSSTLLGPAKIIKILKILGRIARVSESNFESEYEKILVLSSRRFNDFGAHKCIKAIKNKDQVIRNSRDSHFKDVVTFKDSQMVDLFTKNDLDQFKIIFLIGHGDLKLSKKFIYFNSFDGRKYHLEKEHINANFNSNSYLFLFSCEADTYNDLSSTMSNLKIPEQEIIRHVDISAFVNSFMVIYHETKDINLSIEGAQLIGLELQD